MIDLLRNRLEKYSATNAVQEEQALKEILQEITLYALWRSGFFEIAAFQGGTSLRILYGLPRFSEDLDFILLKPDPAFEWSHYFSICVCLVEVACIGTSRPAFMGLRLFPRKPRVLLDHQEARSHFPLGRRSPFQ